MKINLTAQEWFDAAWERAQNPIQSLRPSGSCSYNQNFNGGCFIGCALPDQRLKERSAPASFLIRENEIDVIGCDKPEAITFLNTLQSIHDHVPVEKWEWNLVQFAKEHKLTKPTGPE